MELRKLRPVAGRVTLQAHPETPDMCRNIRALHNFEPPATSEEIHAASLQFVRKISGSTRPAQRNVVAFDRAVEHVASAVAELLDSLETDAAPRNREDVAARARARARKRFG